MCLVGSITSRLAALEHDLQSGLVTWKKLLESATLWRRLESPGRAESYLRKALKLAPDEAEIWCLLSASLLDQQHLPEALAAIDEAISRQPSLVAAQLQLGRCRRYQARAVQLAASRNDWHQFNEIGLELLDQHRHHLASHSAPIVEPFSALGFLLSGREQRLTAEAQADRFLDQQRLERLPRPEAKPNTDGRLRIGYVSADFRDNAAGHLLLQMFAHHDRQRFSITGYAIGPNDGSEFRRQIEGDIENFVDLQYMDDVAAAKTIADDGIDLLVDLMGFAGNHRAGIFARRPAPTQICWLGYCMTTGAPWIDEYYADRFVVLEEQREFFSEEIRYFPDCYQIYSPLDLHNIEMERATCGLPENAFVYACFNAAEKVDPSILDCWSDILHARQDAVLWLLATSEQRERYLERFARRQITARQLVFAPMWPKRQHLARLAHVDLLLDTPLCNAHTTASDALFMGVPVLTMPGELMAQRVAGSVCRAAGLPDLVVASMEEYRRKAITLGKDKQMINRLKRKLAGARHRAPLFDLPRFVNNLERMFEGTFRRWSGQ